MPYINGLWIPQAAGPRPTRRSHGIPSRAGTAGESTRQSETRRNGPSGRGWGDIHPDSGAPNNSPQHATFVRARAEMLGEGGGAPPTPWDLPTPPGGGGGSSRRGGGGGGGLSLAAQQRAAQSQIDMLLSLMNSGQLTSPQREHDTSANDALRGRVSAAGDADRGSMNSTLDQLASFLGSQTNAWAGAPTAEGAGVATDDLSALLASQGGSDAGLRAQAEFLEGQNDAGAQASNRFAEAMRMIGEGERTSRLAEAEQARSFGSQSISNALLGMNASLDREDATDRRRIEDQNFQQRLADRQAMMQLIAQIGNLAAGAGINSPSLDIEKLLGGLT